MQTPFKRPLRGQHMSRKKTENVYSRQIEAYVNFRFLSSSEFVPVYAEPRIWGREATFLRQFQPGLKKPRVPGSMRKVR